MIWDDLGRSNHFLQNSGYDSFVCLRKESTTIRKCPKHRPEGVSQTSLVWTKTSLLWAKTSLVWAKTSLMWAKTSLVWAKTSLVWAKTSLMHRSLLWATSSMCPNSFRSTIRITCLSSSRLCSYFPMSENIMERNSSCF